MHSVNLAHMYHLFTGSKCRLACLLRFLSGFAGKERRILCKGSRAGYRSGQAGMKFLLPIVPLFARCPGVSAVRQERSIDFAASCQTVICCFITDETPEILPEILEIHQRSQRTAGTRRVVGEALVTILMIKMISLHLYTIRLEMQRCSSAMSHHLRTAFNKRCPL